MRTVRQSSYKSLHQKGPKLAVGQFQVGDNAVAKSRSIFQLSRDGRCGISADSPTRTTSYSDRGSVSILGVPTGPLQNLAQRDATEAAVPSCKVTRTPGWECRKPAMISGNRYVPVSDDATTATEPEPLFAAPRPACTRRASARVRSSRRNHQHS